MKYELADIMNNHRWFIMGLAMISVILFHQPWFDWGPFDFFHRTGFYGVEVFLFVSGWGIFQSLSRNPIKIYFKNRIIRMMPTCIFIGIMQAIFCLCGWDNGVNHPLAYIFMCLGLFKWFIYAILFYYAVAPLVYMVLLRNGFLFEGLMFGVIGICYVNRHFHYLESTDLLTIIPNVLYRFPGFLMGMWLAHIPGCFPILAKLGFLPLLVFFYQTFCAETNSSDVILNSLLFLLSVPFLFSVLSYCVKSRDCWWYRAIALTGICSLELYLWHEFYIIGFASFYASNLWIQVIGTFMFTSLSVWSVRRCLYCGKRLFIK